MKNNNLKEINEIIKPCGLLINEKGELLTIYEGKQIKVGRARPSTPEEILRTEAIDNSLGIKRKKRNWVIEMKNGDEKLKFNV